MGDFVLVDRIEEELYRDSRSVTDLQAECIDVTFTIIITC